MNSVPRMLRAWFGALALLASHTLHAAEADRILLRQPMPKVPAHIVTEAKIGDQRQPVVMLLDTGASYLCLDPSLELGPHSVIGQKNVVAADGSMKMMTLLAGPTLRVGRRAIQRPTTLQTDMSALSRFTGRPLAGIIGMETLGGGKTLLDYDNGIFEMHDGPWRLPATAREVDLEKDQLSTVFRAGILGQPVLFRVDSGSDNCIELQQDVFRQLVSDGSIEPAGTDARALSIRGVTSANRGWFLKGELMGKPLRGVSVNANPSISILGLAWLYGFNVEIDFTARKMRWQPRPDAKSPGNLQWMLGAILAYEQGGAKIERLRPGGGAAEAAGLRLGDAIVEFGSLKAAEMNTATLGEAVADAADKEVVVRYLRKADGARVEAKLKLPSNISDWDFAGRDILNGK